MDSRQKRDTLGARNAGSRGFLFRMHIFVQRHLHALFASLGQLWRSPLATLMTTFTMAVTLALPAGLLLIVKSTEQVATSWQGEPQISVYIEPSSSEVAIKELIAKIEAHTAVSVLEKISPELGLASFSKLMEMEGVLDLLGGNPLPYVVVLKVEKGFGSSDQLAAWQAELGAMPGVDWVQLDMAWLERLDAILNVFERGVGLIAIFLALAVLMTIGNTIRLSILNRFEEIEVMKLVGAKDAFIRRPFLYGGFWLGLMSGVIALLLLFVSYLLLLGPMQQVLSLYGAMFDLPFEVLAQVTFVVLSGAMLLGWLGAWLAVGRQMSRIEPS